MHTPKMIYPMFRHHRDPSLFRTKINSVNGEVSPRIAQKAPLSEANKTGAKFMPRILS
jgi:hypothetical protein